MSLNAVSSTTGRLNNSFFLFVLWKLFWSTRSSTRGYDQLWRGQRLGDLALISAAINGRGAEFAHARMRWRTEEDHRFNEGGSEWAEKVKMKMSNGLHKVSETWEPGDRTCFQERSVWLLLAFHATAGIQFWPRTIFGGVASAFIWALFTETNTNTSMWYGTSDCCHPGTVKPLSDAT